MKSRKFIVLSAMTLAFALACMLFVGRKSSAAGTNRYVANTGNDTSDCTFSAAPCATIQYAVGQSAAGDTINVDAGNYNENVNIPATLTGLTIKGAQAGNAVSTRTFGTVSESTVNGVQIVGNSSVFTIRPSGVTIDGLSIRYNKLAVGLNSAVGSANGIDVKNTVNGALITNNIFDGISTVDSSNNGTAQAVYLEAGPDGVQILGNVMNNIHSNKSAKGVLMGDNGSTNPSQNITIQGNSIANVTSDTKGAYGVLAGNGGGTTANSNIQILNNTIANLNGGGWTHAIGLEGNTPGVVVSGNSISNLVAPSDAVAVWFEVNPSFGAAQVHENNLDVTIVAYGIAVEPNLAAFFPTLTVDGTCNWWGSVDGPGPVGPGSGARVSPGVTYAPWLIAPAPSDSCAVTRKECEKFYEDQKKDFHDQQEAAKKAFEQQQKSDKENFEASPHTPGQKKAFHDQQEADKKNFQDQQETAKKAFEQQNHDNKEQCKSLPK